MSIDERLRLGTRREAARIDVDVDAALSIVTRRHRRRTVTRRASWSAVAASILAALAVWVPGLLHRAPTLPAAPDISALHGSFETELGGVEAARQGLDGHWVITFTPDGTLSLEPPTGYVRSTSGAGFVASGDRLTTNALVDHPGCQSTGAGTYTWAADRTTLRLQVLDDGCLARAVLLAGHDWKRIR
jgi:hypothetical protein